LAPNRASTRVYVRAVVGKAFGSGDSLQSTAASLPPPYSFNESKVGPSTATIAAEIVFEASVFEPATASSEVPLSAAAGKSLLLDSSVRQRSGMSWYRPARVQLLAAPEQDGVSTASAWSALVLDGVAVPYDEVIWVRTDETVLEFIIMEHRPCPTTQKKKYTQTHVRMFTRSEFNLWREALDPKMSNSTLHAHTESKMPAVYASAQKWLVKKEVAVAGGGEEGSGFRR